MASLRTRYISLKDAEMLDQCFHFPPSNLTLATMHPAYPVHRRVDVRSPSLNISPVCSNVSQHFCNEYFVTGCSFPLKGNSPTFPLFKLGTSHWFLYQIDSPRFGITLHCLWELGANVRRALPLALYVEHSKGVHRFIVSSECRKSGLFELYLRQFSSIKPPQKSNIATNALSQLTLPSSQ